MKDYIFGMDLSSLAEVEECGGKFYDQGKEGDAMSILRRHGMNLVRLRLWNDPYDENGRSYGGGHSDFNTTAHLARRAGELGCPWMLDLQYSDCWTDPGKQTLPKAWRYLDAKQLEEAVFSYTRETLMILKAADLKPSIVAIGNEITAGLLWPFGEKSNEQGMVRLLNAGIRAAREVLPEAEVMLHLDNGGNNAMYREWFDSYFAAGGEDFDLIGLSYYPFWHGTPQDLRNNLNDIAVRYGKELVITETSTSYTLEDYADYEKLGPGERKGYAADRKLSEAISYPISPEGQKAFMMDILDIIEQVPGGLGRGFIYWEPAWIPVPGSGWATEEGIAYMKEKGPIGNEWANQALFDYDGNLLPTLPAMQERVFGKKTV